MKILYVEDDARDADLTLRMLRKRAPQLEFEVVSTLSKAMSRLERLATEPLDLVLTDMNLPDGRGLSLLNHIRENSVPLAVVVITGSGDEETAVKALKARADDYVVKQKDYLDRLPTIIESALNHYRADAVRRAHPLRVLYAESELDDVEFTRRHLAVHADYLHLQVVFNGVEVLTTLQANHEPYAVLLLNLALPDMSGLDVLRDLRLMLKEDLPVVLVCHEGDEELARQGLKLGASSYVVKKPGYLFELPLQIEDAHSRFELERRESALERSESRNRAILNAMPDLMFLLSRDGTYLDYHSKSPDALIVPPEHFLGRNISEVMPPALAAEFHKYFEDATDKPSFMEYKLPLSDGEHVFEASIVTCEGDKLLSIVRDITERKQAEEALRASEERLRLAQQAARVGTWEWNAQTNTSIWSDMIWTLLGLEPGETPSSFDIFLEFVHPDDREGMSSRVNQALVGTNDDYYDEFRIVPRNGNVIWVSAKARIIRAPDGSAERMLGVNMDITERKLAMDWLKSALAEVQKLKDRLHEENIYLQEEIRVASDFSEIIGQSEALRKVLRQAEQVAPVDTTVLILGETGTGKELLAHAIHNNSPRAKQRLVKVNCAALPAPLIESELFGHQKGAFTGADTQRMGRFALADGGTLFLDEVGEMPLELQAKLLRVLEEGEFELLGSSRSIKVDVRVIAATNRNLAEAVAKGTFRSDLYYRLSIFPIVMPPLRERREDIRNLVTHMVKQLSVKLGKQIDSVPQSAINALESYDWPGNVRELRNVIERAVIITQGPKLQLTDTFERTEAKAAARPATSNSHHDHELEGETLEQNEYRLILQTLKKVHWRIEGAGGAAELLNVHASTLRSRMRKLGISRPKVNVADERRQSEI